MIKFSQKTSLINQNQLILSWSIEGEKQPKSRKIEASMLEFEKNSIVRFEVMRIAKSLYNERNAVYMHVGHRRETTLIAMQELKEDIARFSCLTNNKRFFDALVCSIIPNLIVLQPGKDSRYIHYSERLSRLQEFALKCQKYFTAMENKRNLQIVGNQQLIANNCESEYTPPGIFGGR